jgi:2-methylisocitrate lyase-like PEP mutase family enzyme
MSPPELQDRCETLRSLHVPGKPLVLPNAWDAATARSIESAGFPAVATTSAGVALALGYEDHEQAPRDEMLAAAARICRAVELPVTVDMEAGYGMEPAELAEALRGIGAAGCNLEDTNRATGELRDLEQHAPWLGDVREAARAAGYAPVLNARIDVFVAALASGSREPQADLVDEALRRAEAYAGAGADCVYPIVLWEAQAIRDFTSRAPAAVNVLATPRAPSIAELAQMGVARVTWGGGLHRRTMDHFAGVLEELAAGVPR